jgi:hypothetical protein
MTCWPILQFLYILSLLLSFLGSVYVEFIFLDLLVCCSLCVIYDNGVSVVFLSTASYN